MRLFRRWVVIRWDDFQRELKEAERLRDCFKDLLKKQEATKASLAISLQSLQDSAEKLSQISIERDHDTATIQPLNGQSCVMYNRMIEMERQRDHAVNRVRDLEHRTQVKL